MLPKGIENDKVDEFLLLEYETLRNLRQSYIELGDNRFNFYLGIFSGAAVFLTWINSNSPINLSSMASAFLSVSVVVGVLALGWTTFNRIIRRNRSINHYSRGMARIRHYFVEKRPELEEYLVLPILAEEPKFKRLSYDEQLPLMLALLNGLVAGCGSGILVLPFSVLIASGVAIVVCASLIWLQLRHFAIQMRRREETLIANIPIRFRSQSKVETISEESDQGIEATQIN